MTDKAAKTGAAQTIVIALVIGAITGGSSSYLTTQTRLAEYQARLNILETRVDKNEATQSTMIRGLQATTTELGVLNERLKRFNSLGEVIRKLDRKVDDLDVKVEVHHKTHRKLERRYRK